MGTQGKRESSTIVASVLALLVVLAVLALAACGGSGTATTETAAPSPSVAVTVSSTPTPAPTHTWTPGAKPIPAATIAAQEGTTDLGVATVGWEFKPTVDIQVTHLGYYDDGGNRLLHAHPVGIYDSATKKLLVTATVRPKSPLEASYRFVKIRPVTLKAGSPYRVAAYAMKPFDPEVVQPDGLAWAPEIEYLYTYAGKPAGRLTYPAMVEAGAYATANFKFRPLSVASPTP